MIYVVLRKNKLKFFPCVLQKGEAIGLDNNIIKDIKN